MVGYVISFILLLVFAEFSSANFKRLAPVLEAWDQSRKGRADYVSAAQWIGGWERMAAFVWAFGTCIPYLAFATACHLFLSDTVLAGNLILGSTVGSNIINLSLAFGLLLYSGPIAFFRIRSVSSPVFLLLATIIFTYTCLNQVISLWEGLLLLFLIFVYGLYFRRFSSEWKYFERAFTKPSLLEATEGILPTIAIFCLGLGFFLLAVLMGYPVIRHLEKIVTATGKDPFQISAHFIAIALSLPWLVRCILPSAQSATGKAITLTSLSHACLLNILLLPGIASFMGMQSLSPKLLTVYLPVLFTLTGTFVATLLIEKESGGKLTWVLIGAYLLYTLFGILS